MTEKLRAVCYINQFFAQIGGEDAASTGPRSYDHPIGPAVAIDSALGDRGEVVATISCGDNFIAEKLEQVTGELVEKIKSYSPDLFFAGPAFNAGRYGVACGSLCTAVKKNIGIPAVTGMFEENPGVSIYSPDIFIIKTSDTARSMQEDAANMVELAMKLRNGQMEYDMERERFHERGWIRIKRVDKKAPERAVDMLLAKYRGEKFTSEIYLPENDVVERPAAITDLSQTTVVMITDGGLYPADNPDKMRPASSTAFKAYPIAGKESLAPEDYTIVHNGYDNSFAKKDPNRMIPLDAVRAIEKNGAVKVHDEFLSTTGLTTNVENSIAIGRGMVEYIKKHGIDAAILTST